MSTAALGVAGFGIAVLIAMTLSTASPTGASTRPGRSSTTRPGRSTPTVIAESGGSTAAVTEAGPTPASLRPRPVATTLTSADMQALDRAGKDPVKVQQVVVKRGIGWPLPSDNGAKQEVGS